MNATTLLQQLRTLGISLSLEDGKLKVHAPKGAMTPEVRGQLQAQREALLGLLTDAGKPGSEAEQGPPPCQPDPENLHQPFTLSDLQLGFSLADDPYMEFHVRPHYYIEQNVAAMDVARYEAAWNQALARHRQSIVTLQPEGQLAVVQDPAPLRAQVQDWRDAPPDEAQVRMAETRQQMERSELPLDRWPWLDLRISHYTDAAGTPRSRIHYNHNNFFWDGYGTQQLLQEVKRYYENPALELPPLTLSVRDAVLALDKLAETPAGQAARRYWEARLPQLPAAPALPQLAGVERRCRSRLKRREGLLDAAAWGRFKALAQQNGLTPSNALFSVYAEILAAWSNSRHFILSNMMTRRLPIHPEIRTLLGNFVSLYPLEIDFRGSDSFAERALRVQQQVMRDAQHLQWGGMRVMQALGRQAGGFGRSPSPFVISSGLALEGFEKADHSTLETSQVMLDHQFWEMKDGRLYWVWDVLDAYFPAHMVDDMWQAYAELIARLADDAALWQQPCQQVVPVHHLQQRAAVQPPDTPASLLCLDDFLRQAAQATPGAPVLRGMAAHFSYQQLDEQSARIAAALQRAGVAAGASVAVVTERGAALLAAVYGVLRAGAAYVPVDPGLPEDRRAYVMANSAAAAVLTTAKHAAQLAFPEGIPVLVIESAAAEDGLLLDRRTTPSDLAYVIYTSGSTGRPKGVMIDHRGAVNTVLDINRRFGVGPQDRLFGVSSFGFDLSVYDIFGSVQAGASLVYPEPMQTLDPGHWLELMQAQAVTVWNSAPPLMTLLVEAAEYRGVQLPDLRLVMLSGDWIPVDLPGRIRRIAPQARIVSLGGATEASIWSILYPIEQVDPAWTSIPYGVPMQNQRWQVLDDWMRPAPQWTAGELYIGGIGLSLGYQADAEKTAAAFITHPTTGERLYRTGDIGRYVDGGIIEFLGRRDLQVKIQGHRIELGEIEAVLSAAPGVAEAVVVAHKPAGAGSASLVAHIVLQPGMALDADALRRAAAAKLPDYMVPRQFLPLDKLPLSTNGKLDRGALQRIAAPVAADRPRAASRAPGNPTEERLLALWRKVLAREDLFVTDDFFELGGQSFEAVRLVGMIREAFGVSLSIGVIWQERTVEALAMHLSTGQESRAPQCLLDLRTEGAGAPLYLVHPAGGHVLCYRELAARLDRPVRAFQSPGVDGRSAPPASIAEFARIYSALLVEAQPEGPLLLGGWSSGAPIAFEMAAQLRARGREVQGLLLVDSPAPLLHEAVDDTTLFDWFITDLNLPPALQQAITEQAAVLRSTDDDSRLNAAAVTLHAHGHALGSDVPQLAAIWRVFKAIVHASRSYHAPRIDVPVQVLRATQGRVEEFAHHPDGDLATWGWQRLVDAPATAPVDQPVSGRWLAGTHHTLLSAPAVDAVADAVATLSQRALDKNTLQSTPQADPAEATA